MLEQLLAISERFLLTKQRDTLRYFLRSQSLSSRCSIISGQRGIGKSTVLVQYLLQQQALGKKVLYVPVDHVILAQYSMYEIAQTFADYGGQIIAFDEIHKAMDWSGQLKSIYDIFPELTLLASGSSALAIHQGSHDLTRRAIVYSMRGMSFREYLAFTCQCDLPSFSLQEVITHHRDLGQQINQALPKSVSILDLFSQYCQIGYYPYYQDYQDKDLFYITVEQNIDTTIGSDLPAIHPELKGLSVHKIKQLLSFIAASVPFTVNLSKLKQVVDIQDERTFKTYLHYLKEAGIIAMINKPNKKLAHLAKPDKLYLNNTCQLYALSTQANIGTVRELFFASMLSELHNLTLPKQGDFCIDDEFVVEIGGKHKDFNQIKDQKKSLLAVDGITHGFANKIPLWLFGFLY